MPASAWISHFISSDDPRFEGKSKEERRQMALGAYYAKKREGKNESSSLTFSLFKKQLTERVSSLGDKEQVDEASYSAKAARAGKDIGEPGKMFSKIASSSAKRYGSEESGKNVAGYVLKKQREKEANEETENQHYCAKHVYSEIFGKGLVVEGEHADPDESGNIEWYTVQFEHGEEVIFTEDLEIMMAEYHNNHSPSKKKMAKKSKE